MTEEVKDDVVDTPDPKADEKPTPEYTPVELEAMEMGWVPKDQWKGAEEEWTPAKAFIKYGQLESKYKQAQSSASQNEKVIKSMKDYYLNVKEDAKKEILDTMKRAKREAVKNQDYERVAEIDLQMDELTDNLDRKFKRHDEELAVVEKTPQGPPPEFFEWNKKNSWYKLGEQSGLTKEADVLAVAYAQMNPTAPYQEVLDHVTDRIRKLFPEKFVNPKERPADVNEPGEVTGDTKNKSKVKLTEAEKRAAEAFGLSYEDYAKGLKEWDQRKGVA